jgi:hypothetical protein
LSPFAAGAGPDRWLATWLAPAFSGIMGLIILALIPVMPFTEQFARESTPQQYWSSPTFKKINRVQRRLGRGPRRDRHLPGRGRGHQGPSRRPHGSRAGVQRRHPGRDPDLHAEFSKSYPERVSHAQSQPAT